MNENNCLKFKIGDYVYFGGLTFSVAYVPYIITSVDVDDVFEASYELCELIDGQVEEASRHYYVYESDIIMNKEMMRDVTIDKLIGDD